MKTIVSALALLVVAGCGGSDGGGSLEPDGGTELTAVEIADLLDCETEDTGNKVSCETGDTFYGITVYETKKARDADVDVASSMTTVLVGNLWMVDAPSAADLEAAQEILGGDLKG